MEEINNIEQRIASWYDKAPHLPVGLTKWLATNVWWLVLIAVILMALGVFGIVLLGATAGVLLVLFGGVVGAAIAGIAAIVFFVWLAITSIDFILSALAVKPLKAMEKKGWTLLFLVLLISVVGLVVVFLFTFEFASFLSGTIFLAICGYVLFEIRGYFGMSATTPLVDDSVVSTVSDDKTE